MLLLFLAIIALLIFYKLFREFGRTQKIIINMSEKDREKLKNVIEGVIANSSSSSSPDGKNGHSQPDSRRKRGMRETSGFPRRSGHLS